MNIETEKYYPSLFSHSENELDETENKMIIPQTTLYDMPLQPQNSPLQKYMTVFGFSQQNRQSVLQEISSIITIKKKEEGRNYINVWAENTAELESLLKLNHKIINGEILGVYRNNFGIVSNNNIYAKRKGILKILKEYLFGDE